MTSIAEVLHELGYASTEAQVADALAVLLRPSQLDSGVELTAADQGYLRAHSGVSEPTGQQLTELDARSAALAAAQAAGTLSRTDVAERLAIDPAASRTRPQLVTCMPTDSPAAGRFTRTGSSRASR